MTREQFFDNFGHLAEAPNGVQKLRELILQLAVRGKLVPQDAADERVSKLLARIDSERMHVAKVDRRADREEQEIMAAELCWDIPSSWGWRGLADLALFIDYRGQTPTKTSGGVRLITAKNVRKGEINVAPEEYIAESTYQSWMSRGIPRVGDVLFTTEAPMGNAAVIRLKEKFALAQRVINFRLYAGLSPDFMVLQLLSISFQNILESVATGVTAKGVKAAKLKRLPIAIPPLQEQERIVSKLDQLMALCDELEARQQKTQQKLLRLNNTALDQLTCASGADDFAAAWQIVRDSFDLLYTAPETIGKLRQAVLQLAVQGRLVSQDPADEPAAKLLERIRVEKARLVKEKKIRKTDLLSPVTVEETPYELPQGWVWVRLGDLREIVEYGTSQKAHEIPRGVPILRMNNIVGGSVILSNLKYVESTIDELPKLYLRENDLLFNRTNSFELVGKTGIFRGESSKFTFASYLIRVRILDLLDPHYVNLVMNSPFFRTTQIEPEVTQQCGQANFNGTKLVNTLIPLPPAPEQQRIVAKVGRVMALCDQLENQLKRTMVKSEKVAAAAVQAVLAA